MTFLNNKNQTQPANVEVSNSVCFFVFWSFNTKILWVFKILMKVKFLLRRRLLCKRIGQDIIVIKHNHQALMLGGRPEIYCLMPETSYLGNAERDFLHLPRVSHDSCTASTLKRPCAIFWHGGMSDESLCKRIVLIVYSFIFLKRIVRTVLVSFWCCNETYV